MVKKIIMILLAVCLLVPASASSVSGTSYCTVKYYYTSQQNPERVPPQSKGSMSGTKWKIRPSGPAKTTYAKTSGGKTRKYTFDGWYTNMNCLGTKYAPGRETTSLTPVSSSGGYTVNLYGRWVYSEEGGTQSTQAQEAASAEPEETTEMKAAPASGPDAAKAGPAKADEDKESADPASDMAASGKRVQTITSISAYTFADRNQTISLNAKTSSGLALDFTSENPGIVSVDGNGVVRSVSPGSTRVKITQKGDDRFEPAEASVTLTVAGYRGREEALAGWRHLLIDTFFHLNGRKYSFARPGKYWTDRNGVWNGKTGKNGNTQSCITLPTVSLKRTGIISPGCGSIWLKSNMAKTPNGTVKRLKRTSSMLSISYPHKSLKYLAKNNKVQYGDILCRSGHTFVYMGKDPQGHPLVYESGTNRNIGNGTGVSWGHHSGGHANKLTGKINKQIKKSDAVGAKWEKGQISDSAFKGHRASGKNLNSPVHIVCSIRTFKIRTSCTNGTITAGNTYMAGQKVDISYAPSEGRTLDYVEVDGKKAENNAHKSSVSFSKLSADHTVNVVYK